MWAHKTLKSTVDFEFEDNNSSHIIGMPHIYEGLMNGDIDKATEGYILYYNEKSKKNKIKLDIPKAVKAEQILIGGVFNMGSIDEINVYYRGRKQDVYKMVKGSMSKFHNFNVFFEPRMIDAVEIIFDHSKINNWNLIRGVGVIPNTKILDIKPNVYSEDDFFNKNEIILGNHSDGCFAFYPRVFPNEKQIFYVRECPNSDADQDIWIAELGNDGHYKKSTHIGKPLNNKGHNFVSAIGSNGKFIIVGNTYNPDGSHKGDGVSISHKNADSTWAVPTPISIVGFENLSEHVNYFMNIAEDIMLISLKDTSSLGETDLYVSYLDKNNHTWSKPKNMGKNINTEFIEDHPYLSPDGKTLYFSSNGYFGFGGLDIYVSKRLDDTWIHWTKPQNLGPVVNTKYDEFGFYMTASTKHAFFNQVNEFENTELPKITIFKVNVPPALQMEQKVKLIMQSFTFNDTLPIITTFEILNDRGDLIHSEKIDVNNNEFSYEFIKGRTYIINVQSEDFYPYNEIIKYKETDTLKVDYLQYSLKPLPNFKKEFVIEGKPFISGQKNFVPKVSDKVDSVCIMLLTNPQIKVNIDAYLADNQKNKSKIENAPEQEYKNIIIKYLDLKGIKESRLNLTVHMLDNLKQKEYNEGLLFRYYIQNE
ncbi:MAG: hypothetical protein NW207_04240 [Cytophagales bacterium]|nr:hypothetical protein [Cytophagales bacterium]